MGWERSKAQSHSQLALPLHHRYHDSSQAAMPALPSGSTSRLPSSFRVATSHQQPQARAERDAASFAEFRSSVEQRAVQTVTSLKARLEQIEILLAPSCSLSLLRTAAPILDTTSWEDLLVERHMERLCPYAACGNPPSHPYDAEEPVVKFKLKGDGVFDATEEGLGAFCSRECKARSEWYKLRCVGREGNVELLEDVERRRKEVAQSVKEVIAEKSSSSPAASSSSPPIPDLPPQATADYLSSLTIHERQPPSSAPTAPSLSAAPVDFEAPVPRASLPTSTPPPRTRKPTRSSPLPSIPAFSTRPLVSPSPSSTSSPPPPIRLPGQTDEEAPMPLFTSAPTMLDSEGREVEWDADEGDDEEMRGWMEEALVARAMMRAEQGPS